MLKKTKKQHYSYDRVWHLGIFLKLITTLYIALKSYLDDRHFYVKIKNATSYICKINAGVPQAIVLSLVLHI